MSSCCPKNSSVVGTHPQWGECFRCRSCGQYWHNESTRFWDTDREGRQPPAIVPVFWGPREMRLVNAIAFGMVVDAEKLLLSDDLL